MEGNPDSTSDAVRRRPPLALPLRRGLANSARWMPARTPVVPAMISTPTMRIRVPMMAFSNPPVVPFVGVVRTLHFQCGTARTTTPRRIHSAGPTTRSNAR